MKTLTLTIALLISAFVTQAQTVTVTIDNVLNDKGTISAALHSAETFMKGKGLQNAEVKAAKGKITITFKDVEPGTYAVMVLHDTNNNKRMDFQQNGMPLENYGTSNNPMAQMGPPQFSDAKFDVTDKDVDLTIRF
jgi:uncharacterized protein (DUF2141 family)